MSKNVTNNPKIILEWDKPLGNKDKPYAYRWRLDFYWFSVRLHKWLCGDDTRAWHNHPVNMLIFILQGRYIDRSLQKKGNDMVRVDKVYHAGMLRYIPRDYKHHIDAVSPPTWTLVFTWGVPQRWAFWDKFSLKKKNRDRYFIENGQHVCDN